MSGRAPLRLSRTGFVTVLVVFAAALVAAARHQRSLLWLLPFGASALIVNAITAVWAVRRVLIELAPGPADAIVGEEISHRLIVCGPPTPVWVRVLSHRSAPWMVAVAPIERQYVTTPAERGVFSHESVAVLSTGPLGLVRAMRTHRVELVAPLYVAPRPSPVAHIVLPAEATDWMPGDEVRGLRPYRAGDSRRHVDAKATARTGTLQVREFETGGGREVTLVVDLGPTEGEAAEEAASCAAGAVAALLSHGTRVLLVTTEASGPVGAPVHDVRAAGRRLACAVPSVGRPSVTGAAVLVDREGWKWVGDG